MRPIPTQPRDLGDISRSQSHSPLEKLPSELQTAIAFHLPSAPDAINLAWSSKSLFHNIGPANRFLWYRIRYRWEQHFASKGHTVSTFNPNKQGAMELIPGFDENPQRNYYQDCLDILCSRYEHEVCQVCFGPWGHINELATLPGYPEGYILQCSTHCQLSWKDEEDNPIPDPNATRWGSLAGQGTENTQQLYTLQLFSLYIGGIFYKTLCQACASDVTMPLMYHNPEKLDYLHHPNIRIQLGESAERNLHIIAPETRNFQITKLSYRTWKSETNPPPGDPHRLANEEKDPRQLFLDRRDAHIHSIKEKTDLVDLVLRMMFEEYEAIHHSILERIIDLKRFKAAFYDLYTDREMRLDRFGNHLPYGRAETPMFFMYSSSLTEFPRQIMLEYKQMSELLPRKRLENLAYECKKAIRIHFGSPDSDGCFAINEGTLRSGSLLYTALREFISLRFPDSSHRPIISNFFITLGIVCAFCPPIAQVDPVDGRLLVNEDTKFLVHMMEEHPDQLCESWGHCSVFKIASVVDERWTVGGIDQSRFKLPKGPLWFMR